MPRCATTTLPLCVMHGRHSISSRVEFGRRPSSIQTRNKYYLKYTSNLGNKATPCRNRLNLIKKSEVKFRPRILNLVDFFFFKQFAPPRVIPSSPPIPFTD